jgi:hypothetical protein
MMLRNLLDEMMRRRLLPVAALAVLVAVIAPLLFLKGAPDDAPSADAAAPAAAETAKLPARAARLLAATDADASHGGANGKASDPFNPPAAIRAAAAAAAGGTTAAAAKSSGSTKTSRAPVVITDNGNGKLPYHSGEVPKSSNSNSNSNSNSSTSTSTKTMSIDIRYGAHKDSKLRRAIPRNKAFYINGKLVAVFVKYSTSRKKAIFAVAPDLYISGPVKCRVENGVCRYLDIPVGSHARLAIVTENRSVVSRRLDVVRAKSLTSSNATKATAASVSEAACLLGKLAAMKPGDALLGRDACEG